MSQDYQLQHTNNFPCSSGQPWVEKIKVFVNFKLSIFVLTGNQLHLGQSTGLIVPSVSGSPFPSAAVARICMRRPLPRTTKAPVCRLAILAFRPVADQLESRNYLKMWNIDCRTYRPFSYRQPVPIRSRGQDLYV